MWLVRSTFSNTYTSINTTDYKTLLDNTKNKPWYYSFYCYKFINQEIKIPCDLNFNSILRHYLSNDDKKLYQLHLKAVKLWKKENDFYWRVDKVLTETFDKLWTEMIRGSNDKISQEKI